MANFIDSLKMQWNTLVEANKAVKSKKKTKLKSNDRAPGSSDYKPVDTNVKSQAMVSRNVKRKGGTPYNEDMSNRITVNKPIGPTYNSKSQATEPSYNKAVQAKEPGNLEEGKKKMTGDTSLARQSMQNAQDLMNPTAKLRRKRGY